VVWSSRMSPQHHTAPERAKIVGAIHDYMKFWKLPFDEIDDGSNGKRLALAYIDDRNCPYAGNWHETLNHLDRIQNMVETKQQGVREKHV